MTAGRGFLSGRLRENAIPLRIGALSVVLLGALVVSTTIMAWELAANQRRIADATERFHRLQVADRAARNFGQLRYWMTDLAVSLLTLSERNALAAQEMLEADLAALDAFAPELVLRIRSSTETYMADATRAVDAYTDGNRIVGNANLAAARQSSDQVNQVLDELVTALSEEADIANARAADAAKRAQRRTIIACIVVVLAGGWFTLLVLRGLLRPLRRIDRAMAQLNAGEAVVDLPPPGPDEFGRIATTLRTLHDSQQDRQRLEAITQEQRRIVLTAVETIDDGFALFDADDRLVLVNDRYRQMFPAHPDQIVEGAAYETLLAARGTVQGTAPDIVAEADWMARALARHRDPGGVRETVRYGEGWMLVTERRTPDGGTVAVYTDITEMKERETELDAARREADEANEAKSRFLASMSHELRTPLNAIIGYSEMLTEDATDDGRTEAVADLERITAAGRHLLALINDILDLSKIEAGKMELYHETFEIAPLIEDIRATVEPLLRANSNRLIVTIDPGVGTIETDKTKLRQNLFNLLSNATKFTSEGEVELRVTPEGDMLCFAVRDTGIGMNAEQQARLFQAFVQADESTTRNYGGTGLGLTIVKQFSELLGGSIEVTSEPGVGSTFTLRLPVSPQTAAPRPAEAVAGDAPSVLIVDDDQGALNTMARLVSAEGYHPLTALNGETGLRLARAHAPVAIVLDVIMPERDGWSVLRELKEDPELCGIPVILATVLGDREMGLAFGAVDHLIKPIDPRRLAARLNALCSGEDREVLIVDDDPATRALYRRVLVRDGWMVREAPDGRKALDEMGRRRPTLVILDLMMPNLDGFDTLRTMRGSDALAELPVIIATSKDLTNGELDWLQANARDVVKKGEAGRADLVAAIRRHAGPAAAGGPRA